MAYTLSYHCGSTFHQKHNNRTESVVSKENHIDLNKFHENIIDLDIKQFYYDTFNKSLEEYNNKVKLKNPQRVKTFDQYYQNIVDNQDKKHSPKLVYETIITIGNLKNCPDVGDAYSIYCDYVDDFARRNKSLHIVGAYVHFDEIGAGHLHLDYVPVAHCSRGMSLQNSLSGALRELGFKDIDIHNTAQQQFQNAERNRLKELCKIQGLDICDGEGGRAHLKTELYKMTKQLEDLQIANDNIINEYNNNLVDFDRLRVMCEKLEKYFKEHSYCMGIEDEMSFNDYTKTMQEINDLSR